MKRSCSTPFLALMLLTGTAWASQTTTAPAQANPQNLPAEIKVQTNASDKPATLVRAPAAEDKAAPEEPLASNKGADSDPLLSSYNHAVFHFNDMMDRLFLKPAAALYNKLVPPPLHQGISNVFSNIDNIPTVVNDILQLNFYYTMNDGWRLVVNSTVGILGLFDVGSRIGLKQHHEDFGLTLARWGYTNSNYIEVPFFGGGTIRDIIGWPVDYFFFSIYPYIRDPVVRYSVYGVGVVDRRSNVLQYQDVIDQISVDRYSFYRSAYLQHRQYQIKANQKAGPTEEDQAKAQASNGGQDTTI